MANKTVVGTVKEIWRYPVKSMQGEQLDKCPIEKFGFVGDRGWAVRDDSVGEIKGVRKIPKLLGYSANYTEEPSPASIPSVQITTPSGEQFDINDPIFAQQISEHVKKPLSFWPLQPASNLNHYRLKEASNSRELRRQFASEKNPDLSSISLKLLLELAIFATPLGRYYDAYPIHILTSASLRTISKLQNGDSELDSRRFRPNIVIETNEDQHGFAEFSWTGGILEIGETQIKCVTRTVRCSMPAQPQPGLEKNSQLLKSLASHTERHMGVYATVIKKGVIQKGDSVVLHRPAMMGVKRSLEPVKLAIKRKLFGASLKAADFMWEKSQEDHRKQ